MTEPLHPIDPSLLPFRVGEIVAFREDHPEHGTQIDEDGETAARAKYGRVETVGLLDDGSPAFDLLVYDPADGPPGEPGPEHVIHRATMGEIQ